MFEDIMFVILIILTGIAVGLFFILGYQEPSIERSKEAYWRAIVISIFGVVLGGLWFLLDVGNSVNNSDYIGQMLGSLSIAVISLVIGFRHWKAYREFARADTEQSGDAASGPKLG